MKNKININLPDVAKDLTVVIHIQGAWRASIAEWLMKLAVRILGANLENE